MNNGHPRPLVCVILDGWGISFVEEGNAIRAANTPHMDEYARHYPSAAVAAAGIEVGLPWGEVGNSETGHKNIGAGQVQYQILPQIDNAIVDQSFFVNPAFLGAIEHARTNNSRLHLMGLVSPGGVHAHINHLFALLELCKQQNFLEPVFIHMFTDGRDTPPQSALTYLTSLQETIGKFGVGKIASVTGRFYAMDRNSNWQRTEAAYNMLIGGERPAGAPDAHTAIEQAYQKNIFDEQIPPTAITSGGSPLGPIRANDAVIFFNFRPDRARQLTKALVEPAAVGFSAQPLQNLYVATMAQYDPEVAVPAAFVESPAASPLARIISEQGLTQLHIAETEKYAHVTYYFNVGHEDPFPGEERVMIPSSGAETFATEPRMRAQEISEQVTEEIGRGRYDVYIVNFANPDMVGHTGDFAATVQACEAVDEALGKIEEAVRAAGGAMLITADHGNAEELINPGTGAAEKDHTSNPVPLHYVEATLKRSTPKSDEELAALFSSPIGVLADIAPTILDILQIQKPASMTGVSLLSSLR